MTRILFLTQTLVTAGIVAFVGALVLMPFVSSADSAGARAVGSTLEVHIGATGGVIVRGAEVTDISGDIVIAQTDFGGSTLTWRVDTDKDTVYVTRSGNGSNFDDISDGDYISFSGRLENGSNLTVNADTIKNWSENGSMRMTFYGQVEDLLDNERFVLDSNRVDDITVDVDRATIRDEDGGGVSFSSLDEGDYVWVTGSYDADDDTLEAGSVIRDTNKNGSRDIKASFNFNNRNGWGIGNIVKQWVGGFNPDRDNDRR